MCPLTLELLKITDSYILSFDLLNQMFLPQLIDTQKYCAQYVGCYSLVPSNPLVIQAMRIYGVIHLFEVKEGYFDDIVLHLPSTLLLSAILPVNLRINTG